MKTDEDIRRGRIVWFPDRKDPPGRFVILLSGAEQEISISGAEQEISISGRELATIVNIVNGAFLSDPIHLLREVIYEVPDIQTAADSVARITRNGIPNR